MRSGRTGVRSDRMTGAADAADAQNIEKSAAYARNAARSAAENIAAPSRAYARKMARRAIENIARQACRICALPAGRQASKQAGCEGALRAAAVPPIGKSRSRRMNMRRKKNNKNRIIRINLLNRDRRDSRTKRIDRNRKKISRFSCSSECCARRRKRFGRQRDRNRLRTKKIRCLG